VPNQASLLEAALDWFVMQETPSNSALLKAWLRSVGKGFEKYMKAWEADKKELLSKILSIRNELLSFRGLEYMSNSLPINLLMFSMDFSSHPNFHMYCGFLEKLYLNRKVIMLQFETENVYSKAGKSLTPNTLLSQSSYLVHLRKVRVAALKHQGVQYFYSFVESMIQVLLLDIDITLAKRLFRIGQDFWFTIQDTEIKYDLITVLLKRISKIFQEYSDLPALFVSACKNLVQGFNLDRLESSSSLWKNSSMIYLIDPDLWTVGKQLEDLNSQIDFWKMDPQGIFK
jgi:hypothetical protein